MICDLTFYRHLDRLTLKANLFFMLILQNVSKSYNDTSAVRSISLEIEPGITTVLIGPSGCGKSTLIRLIIGLIAADSGRITLNDIDVTPATIHSVRKKSGYVIQEGGLFPHLTARKNITMMAEHLGWDSTQITDRLGELMHMTQFPQEGIDKYPAELSGGQKQRVSLMRALMLDPELLLLDEPLGALDPMIRSDLQSDLNTIFRSLEKMVLLVTHDMGEATYFADQIVLIRKGEIVQKGTPEELVRSPADPFVTQFINAQRSPLEKLGNLS
jgi:osmoprotectant transport system ATP-binding protein